MCTHANGQYFNHLLQTGYQLIRWEKVIGKKVHFTYSVYSQKAVPLPLSL